LTTSSAVSLPTTNARLRLVVICNWSSINPQNILRRAKTAPFHFHYRFDFLHVPSLQLRRVEHVSVTDETEGLAGPFFVEIYCQIYADTGIATGSARVSGSTRWARLLARPCQRHVAGRTMPHLQVSEF
jgi:hypothetical protein